MGTAAAGIGAVGSIAGTHASIVSQQIEADYKRQQFEFSRQMADAQAADAITRGDKAAAEERTKSKALIGSQRVAIAAQGINIEGGSALDVQLDTAAQGAAAELTIKNNAWREAFGYRSQALAFAGEGAISALASRNNIRNTLITGGADFASKSISFGSKTGLFTKTTAANTPRRVPGATPGFGPS